MSKFGEIFSQWSKDSNIPNSKNHLCFSQLRSGRKHEVKLTKLKQMKFFSSNSGKNYKAISKGSEKPISMVIFVYSMKILFQIQKETRESRIFIFRKSNLAKIVFSYGKKASQMGKSLRSMNFLIFNPFSFKSIRETMIFFRIT